MVGHRDAFIQQAAGILAQIEDQTLDVLLAQAAEVLLQLRLVFSLNDWMSRYSDARA